VHRHFFNFEIDKFKVSNLWEKNKLVPSKPHPAQKLTEGMLLHMTPTTLHLDPDGCLTANICSLCSSDLKQNKMPAMSLANGLWIRDIPLELKVLTLPEQILIACFFLAAYMLNCILRRKALIIGFRWIPSCFARQHVNLLIKHRPNCTPHQYQCHATTSHDSHSHCWCYICWSKECT
jgi:hypothetical protein